MINPDDLQIGLVGRGHLGEVGRFLPTGSAPLRPDIDHHRFPAQSGEPNRTAAAKARQDHIGESGRDRGYLRIRRRTIGNPGGLLHGGKIGRRLRTRCSLGRRPHRRTRFGNRRRPATTSKDHREEHHDYGCQPAPAPLPKISDRCGLFDLGRSRLDVEFPTSADFSTSGGPSRCRISDQCGLFEHAGPRYVIGRRGAVIVIPAAPAPAWQPWPDWSLLPRTRGTSERPGRRRTPGSGRDSGAGHAK